MVVVEPLVLEARAESVASLSIAGVDSRYYVQRLEAIAQSVEEGDERSPRGKEQCDNSTCLFESALDTSEKNCAGGVVADEGEVETNVDEEERDKEEELICMGDHVFKWCSYLGIPFAYQHHAIVLEVFHVEEGKQRLRVADFSNWQPKNGSKGSSGSSGPGLTFVSGRSSEQRETENNDTSETSDRCIQTYETDADDWHKVQYRVGFWKRHLSWSGTCTQTPSDPPGMVRARVQFLVDHPHLIPPYDAIQSNCECVALWCKTGTWSTLQAASWLSTAAAGQMKSAATMAGAATATQVTVPATGVWGWLGYTTQVSLASTQPLLLPAIAAFGVITVGLPAVSLALARRHWNKMTTTLNTAFWEAAVAQPDLFVECITYWSTQGDTSR